MADKSKIEPARCELCGELMPEGETMFKYHGYSGRCPKSPLIPPRVAPDWLGRSITDEPKKD